MRFRGGEVGVQGADLGFAGVLGVEVGGDGGDGGVDFCGGGGWGVLVGLR